MKHVPRVVVPETFGKGGNWDLRIMRGASFESSVHHGPNAWHALIIHADGSYEDLGVSYNVFTNAGRDLVAASYGATGFGVTGTVATASSATSLTATGTPFTTDQYKGWTVIAEESTNAPVFGNIGSNTTSVLTVDAWRTGDDTAGTTPGATANYLILPSSRFRYMGVSAETTAPVAGDTTLASEQTGNGLGRTKATYAHTGGTATYTMQVSFSVTGSVTVHKGALFTASNTTAAGVMGFAANLNSDAIVISGDTLQVTATVTLS